MSIETGDFGGNDGGTDDFNLDVDFDFGDSTENAQPTETTPSYEAQGQGADNPAWEAVLNVIPNEFHNKIKPTLQEWDRGIQQQFTQRAEQAQQRYAGFDQFIEQQVNPQDLFGAHQLVNEMNQDPLGFFQRMQDVLVRQGLLEQAQEEEQAQESFDVDAPQSDPRVDQLAQQQQQLIQSLQNAQQQQQQQQLSEQLDRQISDELAAIESKTGQLPEWVRTEVYNRAARMSQEQNRNVPLQDAFVEFQTMRQQVMQAPRPGARAPRVIPGGGGVPGTRPNNQNLQTEAGRGAAIQEILRRHQN